MSDSRVLREPLPNDSAPYARACAEGKGREGKGRENTGETKHHCVGLGDAVAARDGMMPFGGLMAL